MAFLTVKPAPFDVALANEIAKHTGQVPETIAGTLTWGADEKLLGVLAAGWWLYGHAYGTPQQRKAADHLLVCTITTAILPHILKRIFDQDRPDRKTVRGHLHGVPFSGKRKDAFPSGHAIHIGALASAATVLPTAQRNAIWSLGATLVLTRLVLLAHWMSDVVVGLLIGFGVERALRVVTGYGAKRTVPVKATAACTSFLEGVATR